MCLEGGGGIRIWMGWMEWGREGRLTVVEVGYIGVKEYA